MAIIFNFADWMRQAKRELYSTVQHRRGIILGYNKINLDSMLEHGEISEDTRLLACYQLDKYYEKLGVTANVTICQNCPWDKGQSANFKRVLPKGG